MKAPFTKDIAKHFRAYWAHDGKDPDEEASKLSKKWAASRTPDDALEAVNESIGGHGIEPLNVEGVYIDGFYHDVVALYVNMGDTYVATVVYDTEHDQFSLTTWGDWYEAYEHEHEGSDEDEEDNEDDDEDEDDQED